MPSFSRIQWQHVPLQHMSKLYGGNILSCSGGVESSVSLHAVNPWQLITLKFTEYLESRMSCDKSRDVPPSPQNVIMCYLPIPCSSLWATLICMATSFELSMLDNVGDLGKIWMTIGNILYVLGYQCLAGSHKCIGWQEILKHFDMCT